MLKINAISKINIVNSLQPLTPRLLRVNRLPNNLKEFVQLHWFYAK